MATISRSLGGTNRSRFGSGRSQRVGRSLTRTDEFDPPPIRRLPVAIDALTAAGADPRLTAFAAQNEAGLAAVGETNENVTNAQTILTPRASTVTSPGGRGPGVLPAEGVLGPTGIRNFGSTRLTISPPGSSTGAAPGSIPNLSEAPKTRENLEDFFDFLGATGRTFSSRPFPQALQQSVLNTIENPNVISDEETAQLKSRIVDSILGGVRSAQIGVRENLASRGILDSGAALGAIRKSQEGAARDIAAGEREVDIERFLARSVNLSNAQQIGAALSGQIASTGLGELDAGLGFAQLEQGGFFTGRGQNIGLAGAIAQLEANRDVFVPNFMDEFQFNTLLDFAEQAREDADDAAGQAFWGEIILGILGLAGNVFLNRVA